MRGTRGPGPVRASVHLSRVLTEARVTPAIHLRRPAPLAASPTQPGNESGKCLQNSQCPAGREEQTPTPEPSPRRPLHGARLDTLGHCCAPAACIVMKPSGRAGGSVKKDASKRKGHAHRGREFQSSRCSRPAVSKPLFNHCLFTGHVHENGTHVCSRAYRDAQKKHVPGPQLFSVRIQRARSHSSITEVTTLERAFNLDTCIISMFLSKDRELRSARRCNLATFSSSSFGMK